jgi:hypothetical protein
MKGGATLEDKGFYRKISMYNARFDVYVEPDKALIHVFDLDIEGTMTVTNAIDCDMYNELMSSLLFAHSRLQRDRSTMILYHTDGYITKWHPDEGFTTADKKYSHMLHDPFLKICDERRKDFLKEMGMLS